MQNGRSVFFINTNLALREEVNIIILLQSAEGAFRVDANVSVSRPSEPLGVRTEIKNIGSVRAVAAAVNFEIERQILMLEEGLQVVNETRAWNAKINKTVSMRDKEDKQV